jgi:hypothetical protein
MPRLLTQRHRQSTITVRQLIGMLSGFISECCPVFDRNPVRFNLGIRTQPQSFCQRPFQFLTVGKLDQMGAPNDLRNVSRPVDPIS